VLITGGLGYIGGRLAQFLSRDPQIDLRVGTRAEGKQRPTWLDPGALVDLDLTSDRQLAGACAGVDTVVHLAAANEIESAADPERALVINGLGSLKLLGAAQQAGANRFIYFSTAHVYGSPLHGVISEQTLARPVHPYAITHRVAEDFVLAAHDTGRIVGVVVRLSNAVGAPVDPAVNRWTLLASDLCRQAVTTQTLRLRSAGLQMRDFISLGEVLRATAHLMRLDTDALGDGLFNLGGRNPMRVIDLAHRIAVRCKETLGFFPEIRRPDTCSGASAAEAFDYRIDKIESTGFVVCSSLDAEIDATLKICSDVHGRKPIES